MGVGEGASWEAGKVSGGGAKDQGLDARAEREDAIELQVLVDHWIATIDRWVKQFDRQIGAEDDVAKGEGTPDPSRDS